MVDFICFCFSVFILYVEPKAFPHLENGAANLHP